VHAHWAWACMVAMACGVVLYLGLSSLTILRTRRCILSLDDSPWGRRVRFLCDDVPQQGEQPAALPRGVVASTVDECRVGADDSSDLLFATAELASFRSCSSGLLVDTIPNFVPPSSSAHDTCVLQLPALPLDCRGSGGLAELGRFYFCPLSPSIKHIINRTPRLMLTFDNRGALSPSSIDDETDGDGNEDGTEVI